MNSQQQLSVTLFNLDLLETLPEDMVHVIKSYLPLAEIRKHLIYKKYYNACYSALQYFTAYEINTYFHQEDYFGIDLNKSVTIHNYIHFNLKKINFDFQKIIPKLIDDESYQKMKKIIICSYNKKAVLRMKKRRNIY